MSFRGRCTFSGSSEVENEVGNEVEEKRAEEETKERITKAGKEH